jgi:hypothetical protein
MVIPRPKKGWSIALSKSRRLHMCCEQRRVAHPAAGQTHLGGSEAWQLNFARTSGKIIRVNFSSPFLPPLASAADDPSRRRGVIPSTQSTKLQRMLELTEIIKTIGWPRRAAFQGGEFDRSGAAVAPVWPTRRRRVLHQNHPVVDAERRGCRALGPALLQSRERNFARQATW